MLHMKLEVYEALGRTHWNVAIRDLDAGPDDAGLVSLRGGVLPHDLDDAHDRLFAGMQEAARALTEESARSQEQA